MVARKQSSTPEPAEAGPVKYESPWKMLAVFGVVILVVIVYGFLN